MKKVGIQSDKLDLIYELVNDIVEAKNKALSIIVGLYKYRGIEFDDNEKYELSKELTNQIKDKIIEYVYSNENTTYSESIMAINYFLLQIYKGIGIQVECVGTDPYKSQFLIDNELYEVTGEESKQIKLYNRVLDSIKEAVDTLIKFIKTIYKTNNLIFKKDEEDIVYENLIYELSDIVIHHIYIDEKASYRTAIDVINDYMIEFVGRFANIKDNYNK